VASDEIGDVLHAVPLQQSAAVHTAYSTVNDGNISAPQLVVRNWKGESNQALTFDRGRSRSLSPQCLGYLVEVLQVRQEKLDRMVAASPKLLQLTEDDIHRWTSQLMRALQVPASVIGRALETCPQLLSENTCANAEQMVYFLVEIGVRREDIQAIFLIRPQLMYLKVERNVRPTAAFLVQEAGVSPQKLGKLIRVCPVLLTMSLAAKLRPTVEFFKSLGFAVTTIGSMLSSCPKILLLGLRSRLEPTIRYLLNELKVPQRKLESVVRKKPQLLTYHIQNKLRPAVTFLLNEVGVPLNDLSKVVVCCPHLLGFSVEHNLRPTLRYLATVFNTTSEGWVQAVLGCPQMFSYSLEHRIRPRLEYLRASGIALDSASVLARHLRLTDDVFYSKRPPPRAALKSVSGEEGESKGAQGRAREEMGEERGERGEVGGVILDTKAG